MIDETSGPAILASLRAASGNFAVSTRSAAEVHAAQLGLSFAPGARVVDQQTGAEGTVLSGSIQHGVKPALSSAAKPGAASVLTLPAPTMAELVKVQLDTGGVVERAAGCLVAIPAGLTVSLEDLHTR